MRTKSGRSPSGGTAFVVKLRSRHFVLTAKHVLKDFRFDQFRVQFRLDSNHFIPLTGIYTLRDQNPLELANDDDQFDVAVWTTDDEHLPTDEFGKDLPYPLWSIDRVTLFSPNASYLYCGFPTEMRRYDPDGRHMHLEAVSGEAKYLERTRYACLHKVQLLRIQDRLRNLDGFSGSPVLQVNHDEGKYGREAFTGILLRGARPSDLAYFLEHRRIIELLQYVYARPRAEQG
jgi:hypothetical protein